MDIPALTAVVDLAHRIGGHTAPPDSRAIRAALEAHVSRAAPEAQAAYLVELTAALRSLAQVAAAADPVAGSAAREHGATVRMLAAATGMSERAATTRYQRSE